MFLSNIIIKHLSLSLQISLCYVEYSLVVPFSCSYDTFFVYSGKWHFFCIIIIFQFGHNHLLFKTSNNLIFNPCNVTSLWEQNFWYSEVLVSSKILEILPCWIVLLLSSTTWLFFNYDYLSSILRLFYTYFSPRTISHLNTCEKIIDDTPWNLCNCFWV